MPDEPAARRRYRHFRRPNRRSLAAATEFRGRAKNQVGGEVGARAELVRERPESNRRIEVGRAETPVARRQRSANRRHRGAAFCRPIALL